MAHNNAVPSECICVQLAKVVHDPGMQWIQMNVTGQFKQVNIFLTEIGGQLICLWNVPISY